MNEYFIGPDREGERLDRFLAEQMAEKSRSYLQRLIKEQEITVNGKPVKAGYRLFSDDRITVNLPDARLNYVVDFFYFKLIDFPIFNVADIYVTVSAAVLAVLILLYYKEEDLERIFHRS